jgi:hypothetical protein
MELISTRYQTIPFAVVAVVVAFWVGFVVEVVFAGLWGESS